MAMDRASKGCHPAHGCQALLLTGNLILIALNGLFGFSFAGDKTLASLPDRSQCHTGSANTVAYPEASWDSNWWGSSVSWKGVE